MSGFLKELSGFLKGLSGFLQLIFPQPSSPSYLIYVQRSKGIRSLQRAPFQEPQLRFSEVVL